MRTPATSKLCCKVGYINSNEKLILTPYLPRTGQISKSLIVVNQRYWNQKLTAEEGQPHHHATARHKPPSRKGKKRSGGKFWQHVRVAAIASRKNDQAISIALKSAPARQLGSID